MAEEVKNFPPVLVWQKGNFRIVRVSESKFVIEMLTVDAMGQPSWQHHLNVENHPTGGAAKVLWMMLTDKT